MRKERWIYSFRLCPEVPSLPPLPSTSCMLGSNLLVARSHHHQPFPPILALQIQLHPSALVSLIVIIKVLNQTTHTAQVWYYNSSLDSITNSLTQQTHLYYSTTTIHTIHSSKQHKPLKLHNSSLCTLQDNQLTYLERTRTLSPMPTFSTFTRSSKSPSLARGRITLQYWIGSSRGVERIRWRWIHWNVPSVSQLVHFWEKAIPSKTRRQKTIEVPNSILPPFCLDFIGVGGP